jgi:hypothetical protein
MVRHLLRSATALAIAGACGGNDAANRPDAKSAPDAASGDAAPGPDAGLFLGTVHGHVTDGTQPIENATVRFGGQIESTLTDAAGAFSLTVSEPVDLAKIALVAGKAGFFSRGVAVADPGAAQALVLLPIALMDNVDYEFKDPDALDATPYCRHCHPHQHGPWRTSAHSESAKDPTLHDVYNGTAFGFADAAACLAAGGAWRTGKAYGASGAASKCYVGVGVLADLNPGTCGGPTQPTCDDPAAPPPADSGPCADCHAPANTAHAAGATNLNHIEGIAFAAGVHCDFCHKIRNVVVNERPGVDGAIELLRPGPPTGTGGWSQPEVMFGPYDDVILFVMNGVRQPQFRTAELCSGCHQWSEPGFRPGDLALIDLGKWPAGLPIQDTYFEWAGSPAASAGVQCQGCHMPAAPFENAAMDFGDLPPDPFGTRGWPRPYGQVRDHGFRARLPDDPEHVPGPGDPARAALRLPISVAVTATRAGAALTVAVALTNSGAGHSVPTGTPSRLWLMSVVVTDAAGATLPAIGGHTVPSWSGALATGELSAPLAGAQLVATWPADVVPGTVARFVLPTGVFDDYPGVRWFGAAERTPAEKAMEIAKPLTEAVVVAVAGDTLTLDRSVAVPAGARYAIGHAVPTAVAVDDELPLTAIAGAPGYAFGKLMVDRDGAVGVPFWRAVDLVSDNRIPAGATATTAHVFDTASAGGSALSVTVTLFYRKVPWAEAHARGWPAVDAVRHTQTIPVPAL